MGWGKKISSYIPKNTVLTFNMDIMFCRKEWEKGHGGLEHEDANVEWKQVPFFTNVNEDTQLSGVVKQCLRVGQCPDISL